MHRQVVNQKWNVFNNSDLCAPGVIVFFDDSDEPVMLGDINTAGGICDDCTNHGQVVREVLDLRNFIEQHVVRSRDPSTVSQDEDGVWEELEQALHGDNGFGGSTAEIYAYRLLPVSKNLGKDTVEDGVLARDNLLRIVHRFKQAYRGARVLDERGVDLGDPGACPPFTHRIHVTVVAPPTPMKPVLKMRSSKED